MRVVLVLILSSMASSALAFTSVLGFLLQSSVHETGHALSAKAYGFKVHAFRPYPTLCGDRLAGGCVEYEIPEAAMRQRGAPKIARQQRVVAMAGSAFSTLGVLGLTPLVNGVSAGYRRDVLESMLDWQTRDMLVYTIIDSVTSFKGDWYAVAQSLGVPTWYLLAPGALNYFALNRYRSQMVKRQKKSKATSRIVLPQVWVDHASVGLGIWAIL